MDACVLRKETFALSLSLSHTLFFSLILCKRTGQAVHVGGRWKIAAQYQLQQDSSRWWPGRGSAERGENGRPRRSAGAKYYCAQKIDTRKFILIPTKRPSNRPTGRRERVLVAIFRGKKRIAKQTTERRRMNAFPGSVLVVPP